MKSPVDTVVGRITDYDPKSMELTIKAKYDDWFTLSKREYQKCLVQLVDSRPLSDKQRRACYALIREIADYSGMGSEEAKQWMKIKFLTEDLEGTADRIFSLSNASMSLVAAFQGFLIDLILAWNIPTRFPLIDMVDDIERYIYGCLAHKVCCVCGKPSDLHHVTAVGAGRDRRKIIHEGMIALPLCREHHTEVHTIGMTAFNERYHTGTGIPLDKALCKVYGLKKKGEVYAE